jgi:hypothetical protein
MDKEINVPRGDFPFPLADGPDESRYLTWIRNHSNYLVTRGFVDYLRIVAILMRGIAVNFLTILPHLLLLAVLTTLAYRPMLLDWQAQVAAPAAAEHGAEAHDVDYFLTREVGPEGAPGGPWWNRVGSWVWQAQARLRTKPPFLLTPIVAAATLLYFFLFPILIRLFKVYWQDKSLETGTDSNVKLRDKFERSFAYFLLAILAVAAVESLPLLTHHFHQWRGNGWRDMAGATLGGSAIMALSGAGKLLSILGPLKRRIAIAAAGVLGLVLPLLVVLYVTEFLVYPTAGTAPSWLGWVVVIIPGLLALGLLAALVFVWARGAGRETVWLLSLGAPVALALWLGTLAAPGIPEGWWLVLLSAFDVWLFAWLAIEVNLTSVLGLYRDRLASAYLVGVNLEGDVDIEGDVDLHDICCYEELSTAPYHLINTAHNLQHSRDMSVRDRKSDFMVLSKRFVGGNRTGYCRSESLEEVYPQMDLATAMGISAAAAAPNMGANTSRALVALLTLLNIRLGYWIPNPGRVAGRLAAAILDLPEGAEREGALRRWWSSTGSEEEYSEGAAVERLRVMVEAEERLAEENATNEALGYRFPEVFRVELGELRRRWENVYGDPGARRGSDRTRPTADHGLIGLAFSGGGIRSATLNLGIAQAFDRAGVFRHVDYLSSVSGGGYLASSITTLMRAVTPLRAEVELNPTLLDPAGDLRIEEGEPLIRHFVRRAGLRERFDWRVRPQALGRELLSRVDEVWRWVNLSDGGHIENLAAFELLRRRCRYVIIGDGAADPAMHFGGLATLLRYARIDLGIEIDIDPRDLRLRQGSEGAAYSAEHFAVGRIRYPATPQGWEASDGYLLYLKSSLTGDEEEIVHQYRATHPTYPHESTADQFFNEGQFEAYRALGEHIGMRALASAPGGGKDPSAAWFGAKTTVNDYFDAWFEALASRPAIPKPVA